MVSCAAITVNVLAGLLLTPVLSFRGLALGTSVAALVNGALLVWLLARALDGLAARQLLQTAAKTTVAALAMAVVSISVERIASAAAGQGLAGQAVALTASIGAGLVTLAIGARALRVHEFNRALSMIADRLRN
jgi:putative peptidoglycan lipid II flippase